MKRRYQSIVLAALLVFAATGVAWATRQPVPQIQLPASLKKQIANLNKQDASLNKQIVNLRKQIANVNKQTASVQPSCPQATTDLGTWCLMSATYIPQTYEAGKTNYYRTHF